LRILATGNQHIQSAIYAVGCIGKGGDLKIPKIKNQKPKDKKQIKSKSQNTNIKPACRRGRKIPKSNDRKSQTRF